MTPSSGKRYGNGAEATRFPFPLPSITIGEQKANSQAPSPSPYPFLPGCDKPSLAAALIWCSSSVSRIPDLRRHHQAFEGTRSYGQVAGRGTSVFWVPILRARLTLRSIALSSRRVILIRHATNSKTYPQRFGRVGSFLRHESATSGRSFTPQRD